jgi:hypothetical protein
MHTTFHMQNLKCIYHLRGVRISWRKQRTRSQGDPTWGAEWIRLAADREEWRAVVSTVLNGRVPKKEGNFVTVSTTISFTRRSLLTIALLPLRCESQHRSNYDSTEVKVTSCVTWTCRKTQWRWTYLKAWGGCQLIPCPSGGRLCYYTPTMRQHAVLYLSNQTGTPRRAGAPQQGATLNTRKLSPRLTVSPRSAPSWR